MPDLARAVSWSPPPSWRRVSVLDTHAAGEPLRIVTGGFDPVPGDSIIAKRAWARGHLDGLRRGLMFEPRGHADMYGAIVTEPVTPDGDLGVLFMHNEGWSTMCGHGIIALTTALIETGAIAAREVVRIDAPAGRITAKPRRAGGAVTSVAFENVESFVLALDEAVDVPGLGRIRYDLAYGGAFYAYVDVAQIGVEITEANNRALIDAGWRIKKAVMATRAVPHPFEPELSFLYGTILGGPPAAPGARARNVCVFADGEVDRSPTGTGVSGRVAIEHARGHLKIGAPFVVESIIGTRFTGRVLRETTFGPHAAIVPEVEGSAWISGRGELWFDPRDPLHEGFLLR
ncbi:MAG TPA: proline racemase family protein [Candidatus Limnocylindrales bacterium]|nr:proline racemase family protein [Candidatus Limnocylindrales bacterium]